MIPPAPSNPVQTCAQCGAVCSASDTHCPRCHAELTLPATAPLSLQPRIPAIHHRGSSQFEPGARAVLQFLPSGICYPMALSEPTVLGRQTGTIPAQHTLDLTLLRAYEHGVSRQHCLLRRQETRLVVTDLGSANGTYLNAERLMACRDYTVAHGDHLVLGTLHLTIFFNSQRAE